MTANRDFCGFNGFNRFRNASTNEMKLHLKSHLKNICDAFQKVLTDYQTTLQNNISDPALKKNMYVHINFATKEYNKFVRETIYKIKTAKKIENEEFIKQFYHVLSRFETIDSCVNIQKPEKSDEVSLESAYITLPLEIQLQILSYVPTNEIVRTARLNRAHTSISKEALIQDINQNHIPMTSLGMHLDKKQPFIMNFNKIESFVEENGRRLRFLGLEEVDNTEAVELIKFCPNLHHLSFKKCDITDEDIAEMIDTASLKCLKALDLSDNNLDTESAKAILANLKLLKTLDLGDNNVDNDTID